ncbi:probable LRR receptor-like serine/threonine-protein kinase At3g47570 [Actinidia eriantha]|uniref:probable LRR receptor-like serine/threonine-protein kinase At3g47570 n=1 Tax=Actinidia eriantha TaxID=165200 RepID=UPI0025907C46|nr:probable LRR receptor-like serine/threonine-protein kinase At3g47570 [Actinidia eriantha]
MSSWNDSFHFCNWVGVICDPSNRRIKILDLGSQKLVGSIPPSIGNLTFLIGLNLKNNFFQGIIPQEIGRLTRLQHLNLSYNSIGGQIPTNLTHCTNLSIFHAVQNELVGQIPEQLTTLSKLAFLAVDINHISEPYHLPLETFRRFLFSHSREIVYKEAYHPKSVSFRGWDFSNSMQMSCQGRYLFPYQTLPGFRLIDFAENSLTGTVPKIFGILQGLNRLNFDDNKLGSGQMGDLDFITYLSNCTSLEVLGLSRNMFGGKFPNSIANLSTNLQILTLGSNRIYGSVPNGIEKLVLIPTSFGNFTLLTKLFMEENRLEGSIPPSLGNCNRLLELDVSGNKLSGEIPSSLSSCLSLERLVLKSNFLQGKIPESLRDLRGLEVIDFSRNNLSGRIPEFLGKLSLLKKLNLSFNNLEGLVPSEGVFRNASAISLLGNNKLCGGVSDLNLPKCSQDDSHSSRTFLSLKVVIPLTIGIVLSILLCSLAAFYVIKKSTKRPLTRSPTEDWQRGMSYAELFNSTNGFSKDNLIGSGSFGSVYKGVLNSTGETVAVKVLNLQRQGASKSFMDEYKALTTIRHRNLLKIIRTGSGVDLQGHGFKALVFEFMSNGSLDQWLHPGDGETLQSKSLNVVQRLSIAIDVASALEYLHHHCHVPIVHCDLKPSNVLLDDDMTAHVGDFGLASFLIDTSNRQDLSLGLKGSIGYVAPENGMGSTVSTLGDIYSYGILLLEMFTGKRPTDEIFKDSQGIRSFVEMAFPERVMDIVDRSLVFEEEEDIVVDNKNEEAKIEEIAMIGNEKTQTDARSGMVDCMVSVLRVGLSCSNAMPRERMPIKVVVNKMHAIRDSFLS